MAGLDIPSKLRRALGQGKVIPYEAVLAKLQPFDKDGDGALTKDELAEAFMAFGCGGPWFCSIMAKGIWQVCESVIPPPVLWIKTTLVALSTWQFMQMQPRIPRRVKITPESAYGWEPLTYLDDGSQVFPDQQSVPMLADPAWDGVPAALSKEARAAEPPPPPAAPAAPTKQAAPPPKGPLVQRPSVAKESPGVRNANAPGGPAHRPAPTPPPQPASAQAAPSPAPSSGPPVRPGPPPRPGPAPAGRPPTAAPGRPAPVAGAAGPTAPARPVPARPMRPGPRR